MKKRIKGFISLVITAVFLLTMLPMTAFADDSYNATVVDTKGNTSNIPVTADTYETVWNDINKGTYNAWLVNGVYVKDASTF